MESKNESVTDWSQYWLLDREIAFLNHGSFGACPIPVLEAQQRFRQQLEGEPVRFFIREYEALINRSRETLAAFVGAEAEELAFVPNATTGVNTVLRSLSFQPGDELLTTNQEYNACRNALNFVADRHGAKVVVAELPFPIASPEAVVDAVMQWVSPRTKLALLDHVTSSTALVLPIRQLVSQLSAQGVETLVDGAHALGMLPLNLHAMGATYYTSNGHKWLCAPKGAGFLYVHRHRQGAIRPLSISHGANSKRTDLSRFQLEFDWTGTHDPTAYLCVPEAIAFMGSLLPGGWTELMAHNRQMAIAARQRLCETLDVSPPCPDEMLGSMASIPLPDGDLRQSFSGVYIDPLQEALFHRFKIEVPVIPWQPVPKRLLRISAQIYNTGSDFKDLSQALIELLS